MSVNQWLNELLCVARAAIWSFQFQTNMVERTSHMVQNTMIRTYNHRITLSAHDHMIIIPAYEHVIIPMFSKFTRIRLFDKSSYNKLDSWKWSQLFRIVWGAKPVDCRAKQRTNGWHSCFIHSTRGASKYQRWQSKHGIILLLLSIRLMTHK